MENVQKNLMDKLLKRLETDIENKDVVRMEICDVCKEKRECKIDLYRSVWICTQHYNQAANLTFGYAIRELDRRGVW